MSTMMRRTLLAALVACAAIPATAPAQAKDWKVVRIGIEGAFPPWNATTPDGKLVGLDVDVLADLCKRAQVECQLIPNEWPSIVPGLLAGKYDMVMSLGINDTRRKVVDFTVPYAVGFATFLIDKSATPPTLPDTGRRVDLADKDAASPVMAAVGAALKGKVVGVIQASSHEQLVRQYFGNGLEVRTYSTSQARDLDLKAGRVDAGFDSAVYTSTLADKPDSADLVAAGPLFTGPPLATQVAIGVRKDDGDLRDLFDRAIKAAAADGTIRAISQKWSRLDLTPPATP